MLHEFIELYAYMALVQITYSIVLSNEVTELKICQ
jgi:hypothetical protein